ncbi:MAG: exodeoxyribonuclease V subunit beta [Deltaproteobacteria bacterium]|nr:exodeoxyribonuclease V subunit beta [Candidatus Tharpella sp.]
MGLNKGNDDFRKPLSTFKPYLFGYLNMTSLAPFREYDILDYPLDGGRVLIEAAAGSGKTYTLQYLFLRLVLERVDLKAGNILVVTFTEAATAELKERIREILKAAAVLLNALSPVRPLDSEKDGDLGRVLAQALDQGASVALLKERLKAARVGFDEVVIATIHGFCNRILSDYAFECGVRTGVELVKESRVFLQVVAEDYWRRTFYDGSEIIVRIAADQGLQLDTLIALAARLDQDPELVVLPEKPEKGSWSEDIALFSAEIERLSARFKDSCQNGLDYLVRERDEIKRVLFAGSPLHKSAWAPDKFDQVADLLEETLVAADWPMAEEGKNLTKFSTSALKTKTKAKQTTPRHPLFDICERLVVDLELYKKVAEALVCVVKRDFLDFASGPDGVEACKLKARQQGYNDFLTGLRKALAGAPGGALRRLAGERFKVALVDEFQDTDPVQYAIFNTLFDRPETLFYRIGDPKQSIYGFRGADIYAYLEAAREQGQLRTTLDRNFRSTSQLLQALNRIFQIPAPFLLDGIDYRPLRSGRPPQQKLLVEGREGVPFHFWHLVGDNGKNLTASTARYQLINAVANCCAHLLDLAQKPRLAGWQAEFVAIDDSARRPLRASDIAILTTTNKEAAQVWAACHARGVPAVIAAAGNLWQTAEAKELFFFLKAVLSPDDDRILNTALATPLMGFDAVFLVAVHDSKDLDKGFSGVSRKQYETWRQSFYWARESWLKQGLMAMFSGFPNFSSASSTPDPDFDIRLNLARRPQGERALTNLYHLQEVLHQAECEHLFGPQALFDWFHEHLEGVAKDENEYELRLESEAEALQIMTVHKSKGLEFPIVFAPFLWSRGFKPAAHKRPLTIFHKPAATGTGYVRCLDLNPEVAKTHLEAAAGEELAENLRLLYVALTRAQFRLYLAWPQLRDSGNTALMYLRRPPDSESERQEFIAKGGPAPSLKVIDDEKAVLWEEIPEIVREAPFWGREQVDLSFREPVFAKPRTFKRSLLSEKGFLSFSRLTSERHQGATAGIQLEQSDRPETSSQVVPPPFATFPGGAATGNAIHAIFEKLDFAIVRQSGWQNDVQVRGLVRNSLVRYGLISPSDSDYETLLLEYEEKILVMVAQVLNTPLPSVEGQIKLSQEGLALRREMEFSLPIPGSLDADKLTDVLKSQGLPAFRQTEPDKIAGWQLDFPVHLPDRGYLNGFIDLVFSVNNRYYLLDWKTNNLGPAYANYQLKALQQSMLDSDYLLQYHLYLIALHRFLQNRLADYDYETNFGGVYYLYLRGINGKDAESGVFYDRPSMELVNNLTELVCG